MHQKLFILFVFLLPVQTVWIVREVFVGGEKWQYGTIGVYAVDILLVCALAFAFVSREFRQGVKLDGVFWSFVALVVWAFLSVFWAWDPLLAFYTAVKLTLGLGVFILARSLSEKYTRLAVGAMIAAAILESALGVGQFLAQHISASTLLGVSEYEPYRAGVSVVKAESARWLRAYGTLPHPNMLGGFLAAALTISISYFACCISRRKSALILQGVCIVILLGLLLTFSRTAWVGAVLALFVVAFLVYRSRDVVRRKIALRVFVALLLSGMVFLGVLREVVFPRFDTQVIAREGSVSERALSFKDGWQVIQRNSLLGAGAGNETAAVLASDPRRAVWSVQPPHSMLVLVWAELGLVGLGTVCIFAVYLMREIAKMVRHRNMLSMSAALALFALIPSFFVDHWLWTSHFGLLFFFLLAGLIAQKNYDG